MAIHHKNYGMADGLRAFKNLRKLMRPILLFICLLMAASWSVKAQDTIVLNGQPNWTKPFDIADKSLFYQEHTDKPLSFEEAIQQPFEPYKKELRIQVFQKTPQLIQWLKLIIHNTSATDTVDLRLDIATHIFTRLYAGQKLIYLGGAFQTGSPEWVLFTMPLKVPPLGTNTF